MSTEVAPDQPAELSANRSISEDTLALSFCKSEPMLRYVAALNRWMFWDGNVWRRDDTMKVLDRVRSHLRRTTNDNPNWLDSRRVYAIAGLARTDRRYAATTAQWDAYDMLLNTPGGIVDLSTGKLKPSDPEKYLSKMTSVTPEGEAPRWNQFLEEVTNGDTEYVKFLQRVAGYVAGGSTKEEALFFLYGPGGNGKSVFLNTLQRILGDYATVASMDTFTESHSDQHPTNLAMLNGARLVLAQETEEGRVWAASRIKSLTGGDRISARFMRQDFFTFQPKCKIIVAGNYMPRLKRVDEAFRRRLHLLPFSRDFSGDIRDLELSQKLGDESAGILRWIVEGARAYQRDGLNPPAMVKAATDRYFESENYFGRWVAECCECDQRYWENPTMLFNSWKRYAEAAKVKTGNQNSFAGLLENAGFTAGNSRAKGGRYREGLRLKQPLKNG